MTVYYWRVQTSPKVFDYFKTTGDSLMEAHDKARAQFKGLAVVALDKAQFMRAIHARESGARSR